MIVFCTMYFNFPESPSFLFTLHVTISVHDLILYSSAILDTPSTIKHDPALYSIALRPSHSDSFVWVWDTEYNTCGSFSLAMLSFLHFSLQLR